MRSDLRPMLRPDGGIRDELAAGVVGNSRDQISRRRRARILLCRRISRAEGASRTVPHGAARSR
jgi:hypothetical protein